MSVGIVWSDLILTYVMLSLAATALIVPFSTVFEINVPDAFGCNAFKRRTGMFFSLAGRMQVGCSILAPKCANLAASSKFNCLTGAVSLTNRGSLLCIPSISVHICISSAWIAAPIREAV